MYNPNFVSDETLRERERQHHYQFNNLTPPKVQQQRNDQRRDDRGDRRYDRRDQRSFQRR